MSADEDMTAIALRRIADTLEDYMEMSLAAMRCTNAIRAEDPILAEMLRPLVETCDDIALARSGRRYYDR